MIRGAMPNYLYEKDARRQFRKWDNVKHIVETFTGRKRPKKISNAANPQWGKEVRTAERLVRRN